VHAPQYHETLFSRLYPGKQASSPTYLPVVQASDAFLGLRVAQQARTILRSDAGFGSDANIEAALAGHWQVVTKSSGGRRPVALARQVSADGGLELRPNDRWVAPVKAPLAFERPVQWLALRWRTQQGGSCQDSCRLYLIGL